MAVPQYQLISLDLVRDIQQGRFAPEANRPSVTAARRVVRGAGPGSGPNGPAASGETGDELVDDLVNAIYAEHAHRKAEMQRQQQQQQQQQHMQQNHLIQSSSGPGIPRHSRNGLIADLIHNTYHARGDESSISKSNGTASLKTSTSHDNGAVHSVPKSLGTVTSLPQQFNFGSAPLGQSITAIPADWQRFLLQQQSGGILEGHQVLQTQPSNLKILGMMAPQTDFSLLGQEECVPVFPCGSMASFLQSQSSNQTHRPTPHHHQQQLKRPHDDELLLQGPPGNAVSISSLLRAIHTEGGHPHLSNEGGKKSKRDDLQVLS